MQITIITALLLFAEAFPVKNSQDTSELELVTGAQSTNSPLLLHHHWCSSSYYIHKGPS